MTSKSTEMALPEEGMVYTPKKYSNVSGWAKRLLVFLILILSVLLLFISGIFLNHYWIHLKNMGASYERQHLSAGTNLTFKDLIRNSGEKSGSELLYYFQNNLDIIDDYFSDTDNNDFDNNDSNNTLWISEYYYLFNKFIKEIQKEENNGTKSKIEILTKNVQVLQNAHSHNDYWRKLPVYEAMLYGMKSIEADIWTIDNLNIGHGDHTDSSKGNLLAVGHNVRSLRPLQKNLENMYLQPMVQYLDEINSNVVEGKPTRGLFYEAPEETMTLFIDFKQEKTNMHTYNILIKEYLNNEKYRKYLSYIDSKTNTLVINPITIILTGAYPVMENSEYENYIFLDLEIVDLLKNMHTIGVQKMQKQLPPVFTISTSFVKLWKHCYHLDNKTLLGNDESKLLLSETDEMSTKKNNHNYIYFLRKYLSKNPIKKAEFQCMKEEINKIHELNLNYKTDGPTDLKTRIWDIPGSLVKKRNFYWNELLNFVNFDFISVDNLDEFAHFLSSQTKGKKKNKI